MNSYQKKCKNCKWWVEKIKPVIQSEFYWGNCHRNPPICGGTSEKVYTAWPDTTENDFCGEYTPVLGRK